MGAADELRGDEGRRGRLGLLILVGLGLLFFLVRALFTIGHWGTPYESTGKR